MTRKTVRSTALCMLGVLALEVLKRLTDDRFDLLLPHLSATEMVPVSSVYWKNLTSGGGMGLTCPRGRPLGAMARFLLWTRLVRPVPVLAPDPACWTDEPARPGAVEEIRAAWLAHRASRTLEAGPR